MGQIITFAQQKGGAGKTTLAAHLAAHWSRAGRTVALADLDGQGSLTRWAQLRGEQDLEIIETRDYRAAGDLRAAARRRDVVLVDCPGAASNLLDSAIRESDLVVVPCQPSAMDVWASDSILAAAARLGRPARIAFNRVPPHAAAVDEAREALGAGRNVLSATLGNRVAFARAMQRGQSAGELSRTSRAAAELAALADELDRALSEPAAP